MDTISVGAAGGAPMMTMSAEVCQLTWTRILMNEMITVNLNKEETKESNYHYQTSWTKTD